jgi:hypothetical protein
MKWKNKEEMRVDYIQMRNNNSIFIDLFYEIYVYKAQKNNFVILDFNTFANIFQMYVMNIDNDLMKRMDNYFNIIIISKKSGEIIKFI